MHAPASARSSAARDTSMRFAVFSQLKRPATRRRGRRSVARPAASQMPGTRFSKRSTGRDTMLVSAVIEGMVRFSRSSRSGGRLAYSSLLLFIWPLRATQEQMARACSSGSEGRA